MKHLHWSSVVILCPLWFHVMFISLILSEFTSGLVPLLVCRIIYGVLDSSPTNEVHHSAWFGHSVSVSPESVGFPVWLVLEKN
jgi:hypothetical protein